MITPSPLRHAHIYISPSLTNLRSCTLAHTSLLTVVDMASPTQSKLPAPPMGVFFSPPEAHKPDSFNGLGIHQQLVNRHSNTATVSATELPSFKSLFSSAISSPLSPPASPATKDCQEVDQIHSRSRSADAKDYELFPHPQASLHEETTSPLFKPVDVDGPIEPDSVDLHIKARDAHGKLGPKPSRQDYDLVVSFRSKVIEKFKSDPVGWLNQEMEYSKAYPPRWKSSAPKRRADADVRPAKRPRQALKTIGEKLPVPRRAPRPSPREATLDDFQPQPVVKHRRKVSRTTPTPREDMDFRLVPDYSPPISTMAPGKNLKTDWKGHPLDLSTDPDRHMLDDAEVPLASVLRLTASQYLYAKRKIFERFVELARIGKDFNKTSAQGVCKIDVNKASKLWTAFEKVGWFDKRHFASHL